MQNVTKFNCKCFGGLRNGLADIVLPNGEMYWDSFTSLKRVRGQHAARDAELRILITILFSDVRGS